MPSLYLKYKPTDFREVVGQDDALRKLLRMHDGVGLDGQVYWIVGNSGTGKGCLAGLIAASVGNPMCIHEMDAQKVLTDNLDDMESRSKWTPLGGGHHVWIINEAHCLTSKSVSRLQTILENEDVQAHSTWVFTTTFRGERNLFENKLDACPFLSRAISIRLRPYGDDSEADQDTYLSFATRVHEIATAENLNGQPLSRYIDLAAECDCNMRLMLQRVAAGEMVE